MSVARSQRKVSILLEQPQQQPSQQNSHLVIPSDNTIRKGVLKPSSQRILSQNKIELDPNHLLKPQTNKTIKSNRGIQFKNSNQFQRFTYVKENIKIDGRPKGTSKVIVEDSGEGNCCSLM